MVSSPIRRMGWRWSHTLADVSRGVLARSVPGRLTALQPVPFGFEVEALQHSARVPPSHVEAAARRQRDLHRAAYTRIGFAEVATFATLLLD
jgi:hypothetical protein